MESKNADEDYSNYLWNETRPRLPDETTAASINQLTEESAVDACTDKMYCTLGGELSMYLHVLAPGQVILFERYIHSFSRIYPSYSGPQNPFLSILVPMALENGTVLSSLLALGGAQTWAVGGVGCKRKHSRRDIML